MGKEQQEELGEQKPGEPGEEEAWCDLVTDRVGDVPFQLLAGNHESDGRNGFIDEFADCLPNRLPGLVGTYAASTTWMCPPRIRSCGT